MSVQIRIPLTDLNKRVSNIRSQMCIDQENWKQIADKIKKIVCNGFQIMVNGIASGTWD